MRVLARRWDAHGSRPIIIHVGHLVGETLHVIGRQLEVVVHADVVCGSDGALAHVLRDEQEIVEVALGDGMIHDRSGRGIIQPLGSLHEQLRVDALLDDHHRELGSEAGRK